jgi:hypothetical protein
MTPQPRPKINAPFLVMGEVTISVAMKKAPSNRPPVSTCTTGEWYSAGLAQWAIPVITKTEPIKENNQKVLREFSKEGGAKQSLFVKQGANSEYSIHNKEKLLADVKIYPYESLAKRQKRINISWRKLQEIIDGLIDSNIIRKRKLPLKNGYLYLLELVEHTGRLGGIVHRYWNHMIAEINRKTGYKVEIEKKIPEDGWIDQVITKAGKTIAIEMETGKSTPIETIKRDLELGFEKVICVATSDDAFECIKSVLQKDKFFRGKNLILAKANQLELSKIT